MNTTGSMDLISIADINESPSKLNRGKLYNSNSLPNLFFAKYRGFIPKPIDISKNNDTVLPNNSLNIDECNLIHTGNNAVKCSITTNYPLPKDLEDITAKYSNTDSLYQNEVLPTKEFRVEKDNEANINPQISTSPNEGCISGRLEIRVIPTGKIYIMFSPIIITLFYIKDNLKTHEHIMWDTETTSPGKKSFQMCTTMQADVLNEPVNETNRK